MTFIFNPSLCVPVVRQVAAVEILLAVLAMVAGSLHSRAQSATQRVHPQFLYDWTPKAGVAFYAAYNDNLNYGFNAFSSAIVRSNGRTFFVKMSYLFRKSF